MPKLVMSLLAASTVLSAACARRSKSDPDERVSVATVVTPGVAMAPAAGGSAAPAAAIPAGQDDAAGVRAGEWDDNANYRDYVRWLAQAREGVQRLDVADRQFVVVEDSAGKAVPNCPIAIRGRNTTAHLVTMASGRALLFPRALGMGGDTIEITASCAQRTATAKVTPGQVDGVVRLQLDGARQLGARRAVDVAFVLDTTGSMGEEIEAVKNTIRGVASSLGGDQIDVRVGMVAYKDRSDAEVTHTFGFSSDLTAFADRVAGLSAGGGGDYPEDMHAGLAAALDKLQWSSEAVARMVIVIADAPPHLDYADEPDYADAARRAASRGIKLYTVSASGMDDVGQIVMRQIAQYTGASNMFVLRGGAGPQSVGGGDPASSCGGTQHDYASGNLDQLIMHKVRQELASIDADPLAIPGRGQDENAKPCNERLVIAN